MFNIPELRQRYLAHVRTILTEKFDPVETDVILDYFGSLIYWGVSNDPHPHDDNSITDSGIQSAKEELRDYITDRYALLTTNSDVSAQGPGISDVHIITDNINATVNHASGLKVVYAYYSTGITTAFNKLEMFDDGAHDNGIAGDGVYGVGLPTQKQGTWVRYYIEAVANDNAGGFGTISYSPVGAEHDVYIYRIDLDVLVDAPLRINELMASNDKTMADNMGESDDWVELYNMTDQAISLDGYYLTDSASDLTKWALPGVTVEPRGFITFWIDEDEDQGADHAPFKLDADGEAHTREQ